MFKYSSALMLGKIHIEKRKLNDTMVGKLFCDDCGRLIIEWGIGSDNQLRPVCTNCENPSAVFTPATKKGQSK